MPASQLLSAVLPITGEVTQDIFVECAELPAHDRAPTFHLDGVDLQVRFAPMTSPCHIPLGPSEWAKVREGHGRFHEVDREGHVAHSYPVTFAQA